MSKIVFKLNREGVKELLRSREMANICQEAAAQCVKRLGPGYETDVFTGKNRVNASIRAATKEAIRDNYKNNTLLKSIGGMK